MSNVNLLFIHGLGETADKYSGILSEFKSKLEKSQGGTVTTHTVQAEARMNTAAGAKVPSWFDLAALPLTPDVIRKIPSDAAYGESLDTIRNKIKEIRTADGGNSKFILAGFSQGGALTLQIALESATPRGQAYGGPIQGALIFSGFLIDQTAGAGAAKPRNGPAVMWFHGEDDKLVPMDAMASGFEKKLRDERAFAKFQFVKVSGKDHELPHAEEFPKQIYDWIKNDVPTAGHPSGKSGSRLCCFA